MLTKSDMRYFSRARQVALGSDFERMHIGCVAVYQGSIIGVGYNTNKTHPIQEYYNRYRNFENTNCPAKLHAEINCLNSIRNMSIDFGKVKLYIYRTRQDQPHGMSHPCPSCLAAIKDLGIRHIYYTTNEGFAYERLDFRREAS